MTAEAQEPRRPPVEYAAVWTVISKSDGRRRLLPQAVSRCAADGKVNQWAGLFEVRVAQVIDRLVKTSKGVIALDLFWDAWRPKVEFSPGVHITVEIQKADVQDRLARLSPAMRDMDWARRAVFGGFYDSYPDPTWRERARKAKCRLEAQLD